MATNALSGKVAVITGASSGIGLAVAKEWHAHGIRLILTSRPSDRLSQAGKDLSATVVAGDICEPALPAKLLDLALSSFGRCDVIFNNAGAMEAGPIESIDIDKVCHT